MTSGPASNEGRLLDGRYRLGTLLGVGGVAEVYRAIDERLHRGVAVKLFRGDVADQLQRHEEEMRTLARLNHASLVTVFDAGTDEATGQPYLVMALVEGSTLADQLRPGPLGPQRTAEIGAAVAGALAYVHGQGLVHRDIKPANVLISNAGRVFLADFGIARLVDSAHVTQAGDVLGTPSFFAPEQVSGEPVGPPADIYALGLVLLECLTGHREYDGTSLEVAMARLNRQPNIPANLPPAWRDVLSGMTARQAESRLSAAQVADRLERIADGDDRTVVAAVPSYAPSTVAMSMPTTVMPPGATVAMTQPVAPVPPPPPPPPAKQRGWLIVALVCVLIAAVAVAAVVLVDRNKSGSGSTTCSAGTIGLTGSVKIAMRDLNKESCAAGLSSKAAAVIAPDLQSVRIAASGSSRKAVRSAIATLRSDVAGLVTSGSVSAVRQQSIENAALALENVFIAKHPAPTPTPTVSSSSPSVSPTPVNTITTIVTVTPTITPPTTPATTPPTTPTSTGSTTTSP